MACSVTVCDTCHDTHVMVIGDEEEERPVPCTRCPAPCPRCAQGKGRGAYCETTPCRCPCHATYGSAGRAKNPLDVAIAGNQRRLADAIVRLRAILDSVEGEASVGRYGRGPAQSVVMTAGDVAGLIERLDALTQARGSE